MNETQSPHPVGSSAWLECADFQEHYGWRNNPDKTVGVTWDDPQRRERSAATAGSGTAYPKRLADLAETLHALREWARIESTIGDDSEIAIQKTWREVMAWADGRALKYKLNLDLVTLALKAQTANGGMMSETTRPGGVESAHCERRDESQNDQAKP